MSRISRPSPQRRELHVPSNTPTWPQAPERTGPRSAAVLVRRMRASTKACGEVSSAVPRPLRCARDPRTRTAALHKVPLSLGRICSSGWHPRGVRPTAGLLSFTRRLPRIPCSLRGLAHGRHLEARGWNLFLWPQAARKDFSCAAQLETRFFTHYENLKKCMMAGGGESRSRMWSVTSAAGETCK